MMQFLLLPLLFVSSTVGASSQHVCYVKPDHYPSSCPGQPCLTLDQYTSLATTYFTNGSTFLFLSGNHSVYSTLRLKHVSAIRFTVCKNCSVNVALHGTEPVIQCEHVDDFTIQGMKFENHVNFSSKNISMLTFFYGGTIKLINLTFQGNSNLKKMPLVRAASFNHSINVVISGCLFKGNTAQDGGALHLVSSTFTTITGCIFKQNKALRNGGALYASGKHSKYEMAPKIVINRCIFQENNSGSGGAFALFNIFVRLSSSGGLSKVKCDCSIFYQNSAEVGGAIYSEQSIVNVTARWLRFTNNKAYQTGGACEFRTGSKIYIEPFTVFLYSQMYTIEIPLYVNFLNNSASLGGALCIRDAKLGGGINISVIENSDSAIYVKNSSVNFSGKVYIGMNSGEIGSGIRAVSSSISFTNISVIGNSGSALHVEKSNVSFTGEVYIVRNKGEIGGGIRAVSSSISFTGSTVIKLNHANGDGGALWMQQSTILFHGDTLLQNNIAAGNGGAGFVTDSSSIELPGNITFSSNQAMNGGALSFHSGSNMKIKRKAFIGMLNNSANERGGAIYHSDSVTPYQCQFTLSKEMDVKKLPFCFVEVETKNASTIYHISASKNSANCDGNFWYGGLLDKCKSYNLNAALLPGFMKTIDTSGSIDQLILSEVYKLCLCTSSEQFNCSKVETFTTHRGRKFTVSLLALAQGDTSKSATVRAKLSSKARLHAPQISQHLPSNCTELSYNLYSAEQQEQLILYPDGGPCSDIGLSRAVINVIFLPCPDAFILSGDQCVCEERLQAYDVKCKISDNNIFVKKKASSRVWMNSMYSNGTYQVLILYPTCPMGYCKNDTVEVSLLDPDLQCDQNRSGVLCGACATNHSLMLGGSGCRICSNAYLSLLFPFAVAGIVLVVFLTLLRLTVATGMINCIILYANIVQANKGTFFFSGSIYGVWTVFIAWMNLDLGLYTCFYDGMDAYAQTWLQFVFPVYVWILISLIILTSRYSVTITKLIGSNPIAVLATLLLMSYTKLLKIIIEVYSSVDLEYPANETVTVWLKDANEPYLQSRHFVLTVVTTLLLVLLFLPYTLFLLLGYKLFRFTGRKHTHWLIRIKPLLDAYYAPYKMHTRYWTGLLLLARCALYIAFSYNSLGDRNLSLLAIIVVFAAIVAVKVYSKSLTNAIEAAVYLNLIVLSACILVGVDSPILVNSLVGMVFVIMMGIIIYHFHIFYIAKSALWLKLRAKLKPEPTEATPLLAPATGIAPSQGVPAASATPPRREPTRSVIDIRELLQADNEQPTS